MQKKIAKKKTAKKRLYNYEFGGFGTIYLDGRIKASSIEEARKLAEEEARWQCDIVDELDVKRAPSGW